MLTEGLVEFRRSCGECNHVICHLNDRNFNRSMELFSKTLAVDPENIKAREFLKIAKMFQEGANA